MAREALSEAPRVPERWHVNYAHGRAETTGYQC